MLPRTSKSSVYTTYIAVVKRCVVYLYKHVGVSTLRPCRWGEERLTVLILGRRILSVGVDVVELAVGAFTFVWAFARELVGGRFRVIIGLGLSDSGLSTSDLFETTLRVLGAFSWGR